MDQSPELQPLPVPPVRAAPRRYLFLRVLVMLALMGAAAATGVVYGPGPLAQETVLLVPRGSTVRDVATWLTEKGAIYHPLLFRVAAKLWTGGRLKAGEYKLAPGQSMLDILKMVRDGKSIQRLFTMAEGLTSAEVVRMLTAMPDLSGDVGPAPPEGSLLPESYSYVYGDTRASLIERMQKAMQDELQSLWEQRAANLPLTAPGQAVVMASVVEKETGVAGERARIAGVFYNRLRQHMRLQSDPTVIYGIVKAKGLMDHAINHADLAFESPYNTYTNDGLPPQPICNPGRAALEAALRPEAHEFLYFVADGSGGHAFARTLDEHNRNVAAWYKIRKP